MPEKKSSAIDFTRKYLREKPEASFAEIRDAAEAEGLKIYPIVFGRAKALEGLVKVAPYGSKKKERQRRAAAAAEANEPLAGGQTIDEVIKGMRANHDERERYRAALIKISEILDQVL